jgi:hypothetical protein
MHKDSEKMTNEENFDIGGEIWKKGDQLKFEHTSSGSKLIDLIDSFECAFTYACLHLSSLNLIYMLVWCMLVVGLIDEIKN